METVCIYFEEIQFFGKVKMEDEGIGSYECHGYKGNDVQWVPVLQNDEIWWDRNLYSEEKNAEISILLENNFEHIQSELEEKFTS